MALRDPLYKVSVRYKLALMFAGVCLLAFGVGGYLVSQAAMQALEREIIGSLEERARAVAAVLESRIDTLARRTEDFASDGFIRDSAQALLESPSPAQGESAAGALRAHLVDNKLSLEASFVDLSLVAPDGRVLLAARYEPDAHDLAGLVGADGLWFSDLVVQGKGHGPARFAIAAPLRGRTDSQSLGFLVSWVEPEPWISGALGRHGRAVDDERDQVRVQLMDRAGNRLRLAEDGAGVPAEAEVVQPGFVFSRAYSVPATGWSVRVEMDAGRALEAVGGLQSRFLLVGVVLTALASLLLIFPMRFLAWPLRNLTLAARRIRDGDFAARVAVESGDEIGELAESFNAMAAAVEERALRLEHTANDLREGRRELAAERDRLQAVISSMRDGLVVLDAEGQVLFFNRAAAPLLEEMKRVSPQLTSRHHCEEARRNGEAAEACSACLFQPNATPRSCVLEFGGGVFEIHSTRLTQGSGAVGRVLVSRDLTDRVAQDERQIHQERLAVLGEVAAVMAHELNNPLAAISMFNQMLGAELEPRSELAEHSGVIQRNVDTAKRAIRELLDYATDATPVLGEVDVGATLEDVSAFLRPLRERNGVALEIEASSEPLLVQGDEVQVRQIFVNLVVNALQAMAGCGGRVRLQARREGDSVVVDVSDDGPGIPDAARGQVFRPFFSTKARGEGTGLGLSTSRRIAEMHGGGLELIETGPGGTVFRVRLRAVPAEVPA